MKKILALLTIMMLAGCGFHPIYKAQATDSDTAMLLAAVDIDPIPGRQGQIISTTLTDLLNPQMISTPSLYHLSLSNKEVTNPIGIEKSGQITRYNVVFTTIYTLKEIKTGKVIDAGTIKTVGGYEAVDSRYATYEGQTYTESNTLKAISEELKLRLIAALHH